MRLLSGLMAALLISTTAHAHSVRQGALEIIHPHIPVPSASAKTAAGYMGISNDGPEADRLIAIETPIAKSAKLHGTETGDDGIARMTALEGVEVPAGDTIVLEPGEMHIMLMGLTATLHEGDMIPATLVFEKAGRVPFEFMVDPADGMDHSTMHHGHKAPAN